MCGWSTPSVWAIHLFGKPLIRSTTRATVSPISECDAQTLRWHADVFFLFLGSHFVCLIALSFYIVRIPTQLGAQHKRGVYLVEVYESIMYSMAPSWRDWRSIVYKTNYASSNSSNSMHTQQHRRTRVPRALASMSRLVFAGDTSKHMAQQKSTRIKIRTAGMSVTCEHFMKRDHKSTLLTNQ